MRVRTQRCCRIVGVLVIDRVNGIVHLLQSGVGWTTVALVASLLKVAGMVRGNEGDEVAAQYLVWAESEHLGMGVSASTQSRAKQTPKKQQLGRSLA